MLPRLHLVTDDAILRAPDFPARARAVVEAHGPAVALHVRGHGLSARELHGLATSLVEAAAKTGTRLFVNDRIDVALVVGADGVQLGRRSLPVPAARAVIGDRRWIGVSVHSPEEAADAESDGADFVLAGTIYASASHPGEEPAGVGRLREMARSTTLPVLAIGGIVPERVTEVRRAGAFGVAVLGGAWKAKDPVRAIARYLEALAEEVA